MPVIENYHIPANNVRPKKTVKVKCDELASGFMIINAEDFKRGEHTLYDPSEKSVVTAAKKEQSHLEKSEQKTSNKTLGIDE